VWLTVGGFQVALCAAELPGTGGGPRHLLGTEEGPAFVQRLLAGEGKGTETLLVPGGPPRELSFKGYRRSGRCELRLDGVLLEASAGLRAPPSDARRLLVRSWGSVRVLEVVLEAGR
jgi:hypothetical protein